MFFWLLPPIATPDGEEIAGATSVMAQDTVVISGRLPKLCVVLLR